ncbi:MAG: FAD-binding protein [Firmicutes bacterium]|nr:FAD-binding protein [Bacillota bacterium]
MDFKYILNACSADYPARLSEACAFINAHLKILSDIGKGTAGEAIIFYCHSADREPDFTGLPLQRIKLVKLNNYQPELALSALFSIEKDKPAELYIFSGNQTGTELAVRFSCRIGGSSLVDIDKFELHDSHLECYKSVYSGYLKGRLILDQKPYCLTPARGIYTAGDKSDDIIYRITKLDFEDLTNINFIKKSEYISKQENNQLEQAGFIVAAGRGVKGRAEIGRLENIATELGAQLGVSRPVAMNAWAPLDRLLGSSGTISRPEICLALAVSGSAAFYAGIEKSKYIIAVNTDDHAPIIKAADIVIIDDYKKILDELVLIIKRDKELKGNAGKALPEV